MDDYVKIRKQYGEKFAHLCRSLFPTLLDKGVLYNIISSKFAPSHNLYNDICGQKDDFKNYIYSFYKGEDEKVEIVTETPEELLKKAGYTLYPECKTPEDILRFKHFYSPHEELCTFTDPAERLRNCRVWFAVKDGAEELNRSDFTTPARQDKYGVSVISIQFSRGSISTVSIKNRYNHTVDNPDATFGNNLDNICPGLTQAFINTYGIDLSQSNISFDLPGYVMASDGRYYKKNAEVEGIAYCENNVVIDREGKIKKLDTSRYLLADYLVFDFKDKKINPYDDFYDGIMDTESGIIKMQIEKDKESNKRIYLIHDADKISYFDVDKCGKLVSYTNDFVKNADGMFLDHAHNLKSLSMASCEKTATCFLSDNIFLQKLNMPSLREAGAFFLCNRNTFLENLSLPNLEKTSSCFFRSCYLHSVDLPKLREMGDNSFVYANYLREFCLPNLESLQDNTLRNASLLQIVDLPKVKSVGRNFLSSNCIKVTHANFESLETAGDQFMSSTEGLKELKIPKLKSIGTNALSSARSLTKFIAPSLETIGDYLLDTNLILRTIDCPNLINPPVRAFSYHKNNEEILSNLKNISLKNQEKLKNKDIV